MKIFLFGHPHIRLEIAGSTNTYARQLIEAGRPLNGTVITSAFQYNGRGQGIHQWESETGLNLLCSYILYPEIQVNQLFLINKMIACAVHQSLRNLTGCTELKIKWPNDIMVNSGKISGMLVETGIKGEVVSHCIAGIGINVNQEIFKVYHPEAISIRMLTDKHTDLDMVLGELNKSLSGWYEKLKRNHEEVNNYYLDHLYHRNQQMEYVINGKKVSATICGVDDEGRLLLKTGGDEILKLRHGELHYLF